MFLYIIQLCDWILVVFYFYLISLIVYEVQAEVKETAEDEQYSTT
jgi:hypothetical protein